jgi:hypothetical protein
MLVPYNGVRYHLKEWHRDGVDKPRNKEELFNLRHSSARNVIERLFGVFKRKFRILSKGNEYSIERQVALVNVLAALFNFIAQRDREDVDFDIPEGVETTSPSTHQQEPQVVAVRETNQQRRDRKEMDNKREEIAQAMWEAFSRRHRE